MYPFHMLAHAILQEEPLAIKRSHSLKNHNHHLNKFNSFPENREFLKITQNLTIQLSQNDLSTRTGNLMSSDLYTVVVKGRSGGLKGALGSTTTVH